MESDHSKLTKFDTPKLEGTKYGAWKFKVKMLLTHRGLWGSVIGSDDDATNEEKTL